MAAVVDATTADGATREQLSSLDDTDCYATAWEEILRQSQQQGQDGKGSGLALKWGGRGQGGRGYARRTFQPKDVVVDNIRLEYVASGVVACSKLLLEDATLKLLSGKVYGLIGRNGCGKTSLLKRIHAGKVPGFPPHISTLYISQQVEEFTALPCVEQAKNSTIDVSSSGTQEPAASTTSETSITMMMTPVQYVSKRYEEHSQSSKLATKQEIEQLEAELDELDVESEQDQVRIEELGIQISQLEENDDDFEKSLLKKEVEDALAFMCVPSALWGVPMSRLSPGIQKKVILSVTLLCRNCDLMLLDEPTNHLDIPGLIQLRQMIFACEKRGATILLVSHDIDLLNDVVTDIIEVSTQRKLDYYTGNYNTYLFYKQQNDLHSLRQVLSLEKKRNDMMQTLENIKKQPVPRRGGGKKKAKQIESQKKKIEREGLNVDAKGHKWKQQKAGTGMKAGSINAMVDASTRRGLTTQQLLKLTEKSLRPPPDKAVQFVFRNPKCQWSEPIITALEVGHGYGEDVFTSQREDLLESMRLLDEDENLGSAIPRELLLPKPGMLFDFVDFCIDEGNRYCILGNNNCGKSTLLRVLAKLEEPLDGTVKHALNVEIGYLDEHVVNDMLLTPTDAQQHKRQEVRSENCLAFLSGRFPQKNEQEIRSELSAFGLSNTQAKTSIRFLSGGERRRLCLAAVMLADPQLLVLDNPTSDMDVESVDALIYGLSKWTGTIVMISHDAYFIRSLGKDLKCFALVDGRLRRIITDESSSGIDTYLRSFVR